MRAAIFAMVCAGCLPYVDPADEPAASPSPREAPAAPRRVPVIDAPVSAPAIRKPPAVVQILSRATGLAVEGAEVKRREALGWTDADGFATVAAQSGPWRVTATGFVTTEFVVARPIVLYLQPAAAFEIRVTDVSGTPIDEARVRCIERHDRRETARSEWVHTNHEGLTRLADAAPGPKAQFEVAARGWFTLTVPASLVRADRDGRVLRLDTPAPVLARDRDDPHGHHDRHGGAAGRGVWITLHRHGGHEPVPGYSLGAAAAGRPGRRRIRTGIDGRVRLPARGRRVFVTSWDPFAPLGLDPECAECGAGDDQIFHLRRRPMVRLERSGLPNGVTATLVALGRSAPVRWNRRQPVPGGVDLAVRLVTATADVIEPLGQVAFDASERRIGVDWPHVAVVAAWTARPAAPVAPPDQGAGRLTVSVRDYTGRFVSGSVSLDGAKPKRGARLDFGRVAAGPHRLVVWARGREARVHAVAVVAGQEARVVMPLARAK